MRCKTSNAWKWFILILKRENGRISLNLFSWSLFFCIVSVKEHRFYIGVCTCFTLLLKLHIKLIQYIEVSLCLFLLVWIILLRRRDNVIDIILEYLYCGSHTYFFYLYEMILDAFCLSLDTFYNEHNIDDDRSFTSKNYETLLLKVPRIQSYQTSILYNEILNSHESFRMSNMII